MRLRNSYIKNEIKRHRDKIMKVLVLLAEGFEEIEALTVVDILRRAEIDVTAAGLREGTVEGSHGIKVIPDLALDKIDPADFDALVLPGGFPGFVNLGEDQRVLQMIREMDRAGKWVAAICGGPSVLIKAGITAGRRATVSPSGRKEMEACAIYSPERVVVDGNLVTSQAPGTAMEFALRLVELLAGEERMKAVKSLILAIFKGE
jgi:4-methyl-5(b-hydroxyethyl)-thiazole monophosphate biosynthesis